MIVLLEPRRPPGFISGGYRYQDAIGRRLVQQGHGEYVAVAPDAMAAAMDDIRNRAPKAVVVVDGRFAELLGQPLPQDCVALLHMRPDWVWYREPLHVIATAATTARELAAEARSVAVVRPGLEDCFQPGLWVPHGKRLRIACVGTVTANKGQAMLLHALQASQVDCELHLFGDASDDQAAVGALRAAAGGFPLYFHGVLEPAQVAAQLHSVDLLVSASRHESFGMAVAEGAACGVPVLAFATGEIASFVAHGRNGWLLPPSASDREFAAVLHPLLRSPERLSAARACAQRPSIGSWDDAAAAFVAACAVVARG